MSDIIDAAADSGYVETVFRESWPGLSRPSTPCVLDCWKKDVDARDKRGHDGGEGDSITSESALIEQSRRPPCTPRSPISATR
jgi:hypothetical protein